MRSSHPLVAVVLWDMDGTLVDTEDVWADAFAALARDAGAVPPRSTIDALRGLTTDNVARELMRYVPHLSLPEARERLEDSVAAAIGERMPFCAGAIDLVRRFYAAGIPQAIVTASNKKTAIPVAQAFHREIAPDGPGVFQALVTDEDVEYGKPHAQPYLLAARRLGVEPVQTLAFEDSLTGARSALAAGVMLITVGAALADADLPATPIAHVASLTELSGKPDVDDSNSFPASSLFS